MKAGTREARAPAEGTEHPRALVRKTLLEIGRRRSARDARACGELFALIEKVLAIRRHLLEGLARRGLSEAKFCTLTLLVGDAPAPWTPSDLAHHAGVTRATMTEVLDQMVNAGWVTRTLSDEDRRKWVLRLTKKGRNVAEGAIEALMKSARESAGIANGKHRGVKL